MRKLAVLMCVVATLSIFSACQKEPVPTHKNYTHGVYQVTITADELSNDHVGNAWQTVYTCEGKPITGSELWTVPLGTTKELTINVTITEKDKWPDVGAETIPVILTDGFQASATITVTENKGRYKGNTALWEIICKVKLIERTEQELL